MERRVDSIGEVTAFGERAIDREPCAHEIAGSGRRLTVDRGETVAPLRLEHYPDTGIARLHTGLADVTLRKAHVSEDRETGSVSIAGESDQEWMRASIYPSGAVVFVSAPRGLDRDDVGVLDPVQTSVPDRLESPTTTTSPSSGVESASAPQSPDTEHPRVSLTGRVGAAPHFRTTKADTLVCSFPLAVHDEDRRTTWHKIVAFNDRAKKLQENPPVKGQELEVVGYLHVKERTDRKTGEVKQVEEVWAAVVKAPRNDVTQD